MFMSPPGPPLGQRAQSADRIRQHFEQRSNSPVHVYTGDEKQPKVLCNPVIYDKDADRVRPFQENEWANFERTPNRMAAGQNNAAAVERPSAYRGIVENALNLAFLAANCNQLRLLTNSPQEMPTYQASVGMVIVSLVLQVFSGIGMLLISTNDGEPWRRLKTLVSVIAAVIAIVNLGIVTLLNILLESN